MKRNKIILSILILSIVILILSGCGGIGGPTVPSTPDPSDDFVLIQVKDPESNIIIISGGENEETIVILGDKNNQGDPTKITGTIYVSELGYEFYIETGIDRLPTYIIDYEGNKITFENYTNSTVDVTFYNPNENLIVGPNTIDVNPGDLLAIKDFLALIKSHDSFYSQPKISPWNILYDSLHWDVPGLDFLFPSSPSLPDYEYATPQAATVGDLAEELFKFLGNAFLWISSQEGGIMTVVTELAGNPCFPPFDSPGCDPVWDIIADIMEEESNGEDFINIISVTPDSGLIDGKNTNFSVVVEYNLATSDNGELSIAFNNLLNNEGNPGNHWVITNASYYINKGSGIHEFNVVVTPKDWGSEGDFNVWACIDEIPQITNWLLDCDEKILTF